MKLGEKDNKLCIRAARWRGLDLLIVPKILNENVSHVKSDIYKYIHMYGVGLLLEGVHCTLNKKNHFFFRYQIIFICYTSTMEFFLNCVWKF